MKRFEMVAANQVAHEDHTHEETRIVASGIVYDQDDNITFIRWMDGSGAFGIYPNPGVLFNTSSSDDTAISINWPDGEPIAVTPEHTYAHSHNDEHEHIH